MDPTYSTNYIEDLYHGPKVWAIDTTDYRDHLQTLHCPYPFTENVDIDIHLLTQAEIQTIEPPVRNGWNRPQWHSSLQETDGELDRSGYHKKLEDWLCAGTPSEASLHTNLGADTDEWLVGNPDGGLPALMTTVGVASPTYQLWPVIPAHAMEPPPPLLSSGPLIEIATEAQCFYSKQPPPPTERPEPPGNNQEPFALSCSPKAHGITSSLTGEGFRGTINGDISPSHTGSSLENENQPSMEGERPSPRGRDVLAAPKTEERRPHHVAVSTTFLGQSRDDQKSSAPTRPPEVPPPDKSSFSPSNSSHGNTGRTLRKRPFSQVSSQSVAPRPVTEELAVRRTLRTRQGHKIQPQLPGPLASRKVAGVSPSVFPPTKKQLPQYGTREMSTRKTSLLRQESPPVELVVEQPQKRRCKQPEPVDGSSNNNNIDDDDLDNQNLEARLVKWGFVRKRLLHCPCGMKFARRWDAGRHWVNSSVHKAERQKLGDFSDSTRFRCAECGEVMSRKDSLKRHMTSCGLRKKRRYRSGWNPNAGSPGKSSALGRERERVC